MSSDEEFATFKSQIKAHAVLMSVGYLIILPLGILLPRYARTFTNKWFYGHAGLGIFLAGPIILAGFGLGVHATNIQVKAGLTEHLNDPHKKTGVALFILYVLQVLIGMAAHQFKQPSFGFLLHRTPHQWLHIALGLAIMSLAFYQVHLGYTFEWLNYVQSLPPSSVDKAWMAWVIIIPVLYGLGLALVPRQISQESASRREGSSSATPLQRKEASA